MAEDMWRPPVNRLMRTLDRSFFRKVLDLKAARIFDNKDISKLRASLMKSKDTLQQDRLVGVVPDPDSALAEAGKKCILLRPEVRLHSEQVTSQESDGQLDGSASKWPHSELLQQLVDQERISLIPYTLHLDYDYWTYHDIITAILPDDEHGEIPSGFALVGHVAHLNLRDEYLKYKHLIAEILMDKNPGVKTVINKIDDVGEENEFRTFKYEVLIGPDDMKVTVTEKDCIFKFDYSKVYWNTRLNTEHRRLVDMFETGEAVCDVMAGIGPFAVPAGKKEVFVWANDLNPDSFESLSDAVARNKVDQFVRPFNEDGRSFIRDAVVKISNTQHSVEIVDRPSRREPKSTSIIRKVRTVRHPTTFDHFVMNLPATALTFLPSFIGVFTPSIRAALRDNIKMPLIHAYCFSTKSDDNVEEGHKICEEISRYLEHTMLPGPIAEGKVEVHDVRDVAPKKRMFCATFRLPEEVAFRTVSSR